MDLLGQIDTLWHANKHGIEKRIQGWVDDLNNRADDVMEARSQFRQWAPLGVYISTSQAKKKGAPTFSLRYQGQDVAMLVFKPDKKVYVRIPEGTRSANNCYFGVLPDAFSRAFAWDSVEGRAFRSHFRRHARQGEPTRNCREHALESDIIREMRRATSAKFDRTLGQIQPVLLYGLLPFQVPIPFSASEGTPELSDRGGNIDILARRRGDDGRVRLSVWELKRPGVIAHAVRQSYIYAVTLRYMLRSSSGEAWFRLFGFHRRLPASLDIESVVAVSEKMRDEYRRQVTVFCEHSKLKVDQDRIILSVAFYDDDAPHRLKSFEVISIPHL